MYMVKKITLSFFTSLLFLNVAISANSNIDKIKFTKEFSNRFYDEKSALPSLGDLCEKRSSDLRNQIAEAEKSNTATSEGGQSGSGFDVVTAAKKANNPVSDAWLLITQSDNTFHLEK